jgi:hypothetical protein
MRVMAIGFDCHTRTAVLVMRCAVLDAKRLEARECNALLLCEAADGFAFLHSLSILRSDTARRNLLLDANDHALVADLGYACKLAADKDCGQSEGAERPLQVNGRRGAKHAQGRRVHVFSVAMWEALARGATFCECCFDFDTLKRLVLGDTHPARAPLGRRARAAARHDAGGDATRRDRGGRASWRVRSGETSRSRPALCAHLGDCWRSKRLSLLRMRLARRVVRNASSVEERHATQRFLCAAARKLAAPQVLRSYGDRDSPGDMAPPSSARLLAEAAIKRLVLAALPPRRCPVAARARQPVRATQS